MTIVKAILLAIVLILLSVTAYATDCNDGRYEVIGDGTVQDCRTGLIWLQDANCTDSLGLPGIDKSAGHLNWYDAMRWVAALSNGHCGLTDNSSAGDWRLPTKTEWMAMVASAKKQGFTNPTLTNGAGTGQWTTNGDAFNNIQKISYYWSSTTFPDPYHAFYAWIVDILYGIVNSDLKTDSLGYIWPVRGGQSGEFGNVIIQ